MSAIRDSWIFYGDTHNRVSGDHSNCNLQINIPKGRNFNRVALLDLNLPRSYYLINDLNNTFTLTESTSVTITIQNGNYSSQSFLTTILALLNTNSPGGFVYTMVFPPSTGCQTGKYSWTISNNLGVQSSFTFSATGPWEAFGFDAGTVSFVADALTSTNVIKLRSRDSLLIKSDVCTNGTDNILQTIYTASTSDFSSIVFQCPDIIGYSKALQDQNTNVMSFQIFDEDSNLINLNGLNVVFSLIIFQKEDIYDTMRLFMLGVADHLQPQPSRQFLPPEKFEVPALSQVPQILQQPQAQPQEPQQIQPDAKPPQQIFHDPEIIDVPAEGPNFLPPSIDPIIKADPEEETPQNEEMNIEKEI